jgi:hypothetical protein
MAGEHHHTRLIEKGVSLIFGLDWSQTAILLISTSQITGITGMSHHGLAFSYETSCTIS